MPQPLDFRPHSASPASETSTPNHGRGLAAVALVAWGCAACGPAVELPMAGDTGSATGTATAAGSTTDVGTTTGQPGTTATPPPPPPVTSGPAVTTARPPPPPPGTSSESSGSDTELAPGIDCEPTHERLFVELITEVEWDYGLTLMDTTCVVEDDYHGGQIVRHVLHCQDEQNETPRVLHLWLQWTGEVRNPLVDGEVVRLRALHEENDKGSNYLSFAVHGAEGDLRAGLYDWPPPQSADVDPLTWLGLDAVLLDDACDELGAEGGGGFIPDPCAADRTPLAMLLLDDDGDTTIASGRLGALGDLAIYVLAEHREWSNAPCGPDDVFRLELCGRDQ